MKLMIAILSTAFALQARSEVYKMDAAHSEVGFKIKHLMVSSVRGKFKTYDVTFDFDEKTNTLKNINAKIDLDSVDTGNADRDKHLKEPDFFNVRDKSGKIANEKNRWMTFKSTKVDMKDGKPSAVTGDLTLNGKTKSVTLTVAYNGSIKDPMGNKKLGFTAETKLVREDFGLTYNAVLETGGVALGKEVDVLIEGEAQLATPAPAKK